MKIFLLLVIFFMYLITGLKANQDDEKLDQYIEETQNTIHFVDYNKKRIYYDTTTLLDDTESSEEEEQ